MKRARRKAAALCVGSWLLATAPAWAQQEAATRDGDLPVAGEQERRPLPLELLARDMPAEPGHVVAPAMGPSEPAPVTGDRIPVRRSFNPELQGSVVGLE